MLVFRPLLFNSLSGWHRYSKAFVASTMGLMNTNTIAAAIQHLRLPFFVSVIGLILFLFWMGLLRFSPAEIRHMSELADASSLSNWLLQFTNAPFLCKLLGALEIFAASSLIAGTLVPEMGIIGSTLAILIILASILFLLSLPYPLIRLHQGWAPTTDGLKLFEDLMILGDSLFILLQYNRRLKISL